KILKTGTRIGNSVELLEMPYERSFDIDTIYDWYVCENIIKKKRIVFHVVGYPEVGLGHAYRSVMLANELVFHEIIFLTEDKSKLAADYIAAFNYKVVCVENGKQIDELKNLSPDLVINDVLDTDDTFMESLKKMQCKIVNFEDLGKGANKADLVINALYPSKGNAGNVRSGPKYFCLRDEFLYAPKKEKNSSVESVLITFGGVDEGNLTTRVVGLLAKECSERKISLKVIVGPGFKHHSALS